MWILLVISYPFSPNADCYPFRLLTKILLFIYILSNSLFSDRSTTIGIHNIDYFKGSICLLALHLTIWHIR